MNFETDAESIALFDRLCRDTLLEEHEPGGIGTLGERTLHSILKKFYEPDPLFREVKLGGFVADIKRGSDIVEIQTRDFCRLRKKLPVFAAENRVKVVYPVAEIKRIRWIDPESGEVGEVRRSPKKGGFNDFLLELWQLRPILPLEGLSFDVVRLELEEYKLLTGRSRDRKKYGAERAERIPTRLIAIDTYETSEDFIASLPIGLPEEFTSADYARAAKLKTGFVGKLLLTLVTVGAIEECGKRGRAKLYRIVSEGTAAQSRGR